MTKHIEPEAGPRDTVTTVFIESIAISLKRIADVMTAPIRMAEPAPKAEPKFEYPKDRKIWRVIVIDNFARESVAEKLIGEHLTYVAAQKLKAEKNNANWDGSPDYYEVVNPEHRIWRGMADLVGDDPGLPEPAPAPKAEPPRYVVDTTPKAEPAVEPAKAFCTRTFGNGMPCGRSEPCELEYCLLKDNEIPF